MKIVSKLTVAAFVLAALGAIVTLPSQSFADAKCGDGYKYNKKTKQCESNDP